MLDSDLTNGKPNKSFSTVNPTSNNCHKKTSPCFGVQEFTNFGLLFKNHGIMS